MPIDETVAHQKLRITIRFLSKW